MSSRRDLYTTARRALKAGDAASWEAAQAMAELAEDYGETQRAIAAELGCSQRTVSNYVRVWLEHGVLKGRRPSFTEAMVEIRGPSSTIPKTPEKRAELAAELLNDKRVADAPEVRKVQQKQFYRRLREEVAAQNRAEGVPSRNEKERRLRLQEAWANRSFWTQARLNIQTATSHLNDAIGEINRSGVPSGSGDLIRSARQLRKTLDRFEEAISAAGVGKAM